MKKRMFITTIVMMLVLAVALTTSSLAWFSSANTSVTAQSATFTATSSGSSNVNLKISNNTSSWGNQISLTNGTGRTMVGMIPQTALVASTELNDAAYEAPTFTGVWINGAHTDVVHGDYAWPARIAFNSATVDDEGYFIIDKDANGKKANGQDAQATDRNGVTNYANVAINDSDHGYYYDEFYIHNADAQSVINSLNFQVLGSLTNITSANATEYQASDYTCNAYAAFILFDEVYVEVNGTVPANALDNPGATVIGYGETPGEKQIAANKAATETTTAKYIAWVPFAAFTFAMDKDNDNDTVVEDAWQFADLDAVDDGAFVYGRQPNGSGVLIESLDTQAYDALSGDTGFTLNTNTLKLLNDKVVNTSTGDVTNTNEQRDTTSVFSMPAGETFRVAFYFWLDGYTMTSFTDTTVAQVGIKINAAQ